MKNKIGSVVIALFFTIIFSGCGSTNDTKTPAVTPPSPTVIVETMTEWKDPAGFVFEYPEGLKIDNHPEDKVNYANLEIIDSTASGKILIVAKDTKYTTVDSWVKADKELKDGKIEDILLSELKAKKITLSDGRIIVGTIDQAILFTIDGDLGKSQKLNQTFGKILETFKMVIPEPDETVNGSASQEAAESSLDIEEISGDEE
jgi:hypothetical protein